MVKFVGGKAVGTRVIALECSVPYKLAVICSTIGFLLNNHLDTRGQELWITRIKRMLLRSCRVSYARSLIRVQNTARFIIYAMRLARANLNERRTSVTCHEGRQRMHKSRKSGSIFAQFHRKFAKIKSIFKFLKRCLGRRDNFI